MKRSLQMATLLLLGTLFLNSGCGTITPNQINDDMPSIDESTPPQYGQRNSGFLFYIREKGEVRAAVITSNCVERYNNLIAAYRFQLYDERKVLIKQRDGITEYQDEYKNILFKIDARHLSYFMQMATWKKQNRDEDSVWMKLKGTLVPN